MEEETPFQDEVQRHQKLATSIILWNCEGLKGLTAKLENDTILTQHDIILATETFTTEERNFDEFIGYHVLARNSTQGGRPIGGISIYVKKCIPQFMICEHSDNHILIQNSESAIALFYIQPQFSAMDVVDIVQCALAKIRTCKTVIAAGDFNSRVDPSNSNKGARLVESMESKGLLMVNNPEDHTYIASNGSSTIDLFFINDVRKVTSIKVQNIPTRKHLPVQIKVDLTNQKAPEQDTASSRTRYERHIRELKSRGTLSESKLLASLNQDELNEAEGKLTSFVIDNLQEAKAPKKVKPWFTAECRLLLRGVKASLREIRTGSVSNKEEYIRLRKEYHKQVKNSKQRCLEES